MHGAIATGSRESATAGAEVLRRGGNAIDAAIAALFTAFASEVISTGPGSGGIATVLEPGGRAHVIDFFSAAPGLDSHIDSQRAPLDFREKKIQFGPASLSFHIGRGSTAVPGILRGIEHLHRMHGTLPLSELITPAIAHAEGGVHLNPMQLAIGRSLEPIMGDTPEQYAVFGGAGNYLRDGVAVRNLPLAECLRTIAKEGIPSFYEGHAAGLILADQRERGGLVTAEDLRSYRVLEMEPHQFAADGWELACPAPPSLGGTMILLIVSLWKGMERELGPVELESVAYRHRWGVIFDLINTTRALIDRVTEAKEPRAFLDGILPELLARGLAAVREGRPLVATPTVRVPGQTAHISVIDESGLGIGITSSPGESAGYLVPGLGMPMNNMMGEDDLHPQGFHALKPGTRLSTMMAPSVLEIGDGKKKGLFVFGSGGSVRIRTAMSQFVHLAGDRGMGLREAVDYPRVHFEAGKLMLEAQPDDARAAALRALGFDLTCWDALSAYFGGINAVERTIEGNFFAHADPRRGGHAIVV